MGIYRVEALEKFIVRTVYHVSSDSAGMAENDCKFGRVGYDESHIEEGNEEWVETIAWGQWRQENGI